MRNFKTVNNSYMVTNDRKGEEIVLYAWRNQIFIPKCIKVENISINFTQEKCHQDLEVTVKIVKNNTVKNTKGYLTNE